MLGNKIRYMTRKYPLGMSIFLTLMFATLIVTSILGVGFVFTLDISASRRFFCMIIYSFIFMGSIWGTYESSSNVGEEIEKKRRTKEKNETTARGEG